ncbi:MAG: NMD3-related protein [Candidatus Micrarchaeia archaeon]
MQRICPHCGKANDNIAFVGEICLSCALERKQQSLPSSVSIVRCPTCQRLRTNTNLNRSTKHLSQRYDKKALKTKEEWVNYTPARIKEIVKKPFEKAKMPGEYDIELGVWRGFFDAGGERAAYTWPIEIKWENNSCPRCSRSTSGYFEGIIQLRGDKKNIEKYAQKFAKKISKDSFIAKVVELDEGVDLYVGSKADIPKLVRYEGLKFFRSKTISGERRDGKRLYRDTFLIKV